MYLSRQSHPGKYASLGFAISANADRRFSWSTWAQKMGAAGYGLTGVLGLCTMSFLGSLSPILRRKPGCRCDGHMANGILTEVGWEEIGLLRYCPRPRLMSFLAWSI